MKHNWEYKFWKETLKIINGKSQQDVENPMGPYPIYGSGGIMSYADDFLCPENCTIVGRKGNINKPIFVSTKFWTVDTAFGLSPFSILNPRFLFYFCVNYDFTKHNKQTTIPSLVKSDLLKIKMPIPPMEVQERIVGELDKINEIISDCKEAIHNLDSLVQSLFYDYFGDPITNPQGWEIMKISDCCLNLYAGGDKPSDVTQEKTSENQIPIYSNGVSDEGLYGYTSKSRTNVPAITISGRGTIGIPFIRKTPFFPIIRLIVAEPNPDLVDIRFLYQVLLILNLGGKGAAIPQLTVPMVKDIPIPIPPLGLQQKFAERIDQIEQQKKGLEETIANMQILLDSRMDYWFN